MDDFRAKVLAVLHHVINDDEWATRFQKDYLEVLREFGIPATHPFATLLGKIRNENNPPAPDALDTFRLLNILGDEILEVETRASVW